MSIQKLNDFSKEEYEDVIKRYGNGQVATVTSREMKDRQELDKLKQLMELYEPIRMLPEVLKNAAKVTAELFDYRESYQNPFSNGYKAQDVVGELRERLVGFTIDRLTRDHPNLTVDQKAVEKHLNGQVGEHGFDVQVIYEFINEEYLHNADALSLDEIMRKARNRLPTIWGTHGRKELQVKDIVRKDKLILRCWADWSWVDKYGGKPHISYDAIGELAAFEKLVNVTLNGSKPSTATGSVISTIYWNAQTKDEFLQRHSVNATIKSVKLYKNGKFEVQFCDEKDAVTMAEVLLGVA